jgi:hypothetical protein
MAPPTTPADAPTQRRPIAHVISASASPASADGKRAAVSLTPATVYAAATIQ